MFPRHSLLTIYKLFVQPHLGYGDVLYDQPNNKFMSKNRDCSMQCCSGHYRCRQRYISNES